MNRPADWPERLSRFLDEAQTTRFAYGSHDCCTLAARWVQALYRVDLLGELGGCADTSDARKILVHFGGLRGLAAWGAARIEAPEVLPRLAQRGDVVLLGGRNERLGILLGRSAAVASRKGWAAEPASRVLAAWRV